MAPRLGSLNRLANVRRLTPTGNVDSLNQPISTWQTVASFWCAMTLESAAETFDSNQRRATRSVKIVTHYRDDVRETDRLEIDGIHYDITGLRETGFRDGLEILANYTS